MLILASGSLYRQKQLTDLGLEFRAVKPTVDEDALKAAWVRKNKGPMTLAKSEKLAAFLAQEKAKSVVTDIGANDTIVGSDQLVFFKGEILGKPGTEERAFQQLKKMSGKTHNLVTAVALCYRHDKVVTKVINARVKMNTLKDDEIRMTLKKDKPFDCAGAYKLESSGLTLIESIEVSDSTALIGLPVVTMMGMLRKLKIPMNFK